MSKPPDTCQCLGDLARTVPRLVLGREWRIGLAVAVLSHIGLLYGFQAAFRRSPALPADNDAIEITMTAAPTADTLAFDAAAVTVPPPPLRPAPVEQVVETAPKPPAELQPDSLESEPAPEAVPEPIEAPPKPPPVSAPPVQQVALAQPASPAVSGIQVGGDASSAKPGLDAVSTQALTGVLARPNYLKNPEPPYPAAARRRRQEGTVLLAVKVSAEGRATRVELKRTSGYPALDGVAMESVQGWEFVPARLGLTPIASDIEVPVRFQLKP